MPAVLETEGLTRRFGRILAVDDLSLRVEARAERANLSWSLRTIKQGHPSGLQEEDL